MNPEITFSDILITPQYSEIESRQNIDISSDMGKLKLSLPVISSNMPQITGWKMAVEMYMNGGLGILHRFMSVEDNVKEYLNAYNGIEDAKNIITNSQDDFNYLKYMVGVSIGVKDEEKNRFEKLYGVGARIICVDIASGHSKLMKEMIQWLKLNKDIIIIAGNIATKEAIVDLEEWGADIAKIGIGGGKVCRTRSNAGVGVCQLQAIMDVSTVAKIPIISDGAIKTSGDIAKALIFCDAVMVGAVLAGTSESPFPAFAEPGTDLTNRTYYKLFGGNASQENKVANNQSGRFSEGEMIKVPFKGHCKYLLREIKDGLQSALSYSNSKNLSEYRTKVKYSIISSSGQIESKF